MYQHHLSRSIYRRLVRILDAEYKGDDLSRARQTLLDACEMTMLRLATDREYFARPDRFLFSSIRLLFPIHAQLRVRKLIDRDLAVAAAILERETSSEPRPCPATTRRGEPCRREPVGDRALLPVARAPGASRSRLVACPVADGDQVETVRGGGLACALRGAPRPAAPRNPRRSAGPPPPPASSPRGR